MIHRLKGGATGCLRVFAFVIVGLALVACDSVEDRVQAHYERGVELVAEGEPEKAILEFKNALKLNKDFGPAHFAMAEINEGRGELQAAFGRYRRVAEIEPKNFAARMKLGRFYVGANELDKARDEARRGLEINPEAADGYILQAAIALAEDDIEATAAAVEAARERQPDPAEFAIVETRLQALSGRPDQALETINAALAEAPENLLLHSVKLNLLQTADDQPGLGRHLDELVEIFPDDARFREYRIRWASANGRNDLVETDLRALAMADLTNRQMIVTLIRHIRETQGQDAARAEVEALVKASEDSPRMRLLQAEFEVEYGDQDASVALLTALFEGDAAVANDARTTYARVLLSRGDRAAAAAEVEKVLEADPNHVDALVLRIDYLIANDRLDEAVLASRTALNEAPDDIRLLLLASKAYEWSGEIDLANDRLARAVRVEKYSPRVVRAYVDYLLRFGRLTAAETVMNEAFRRRGADRDLADLLGFTRLRLRDWRGAEEMAGILAELDPDRAKQLRAAILIGQEKFDEGAALLRDLPEDERQRAATVATLVQTYLADGEAAKATAFLDDMIAKDAQDIQALGLRGNLYAASGDLVRAEELYRTVLKVDDKNASAYSALIRLHEVRGEPEKAQDVLAAGLKASPESTLLLSRQAQRYELAGEIDQAIAIYERLYRRLPDSLLISNNLASLLADHYTDDPKSVDRAYKMAGRLRDADTPQYRDTYGWTRYLKGEYDVALERLKPVIDALPNNPWVHYHVGMIYAALSQTENAVAHLRLSLELAGPNGFKPRPAVEAKLKELGGT